MKYRNAPNADFPGSYQIATRLSQPNLNPGETLKFEQYITGYGNILTAKIQAYISSDSFDLPNSYIRHSASYVKDGDDRLFSWGNTDREFSANGFTCMLAGAKLQDQAESTIAFDMPNAEGTPALACERKLEHAPFEYSLITKANIKPGEYYMDFYLTFFNGEKWITNKERVPFKVKNFFERNAKLISTIALAASILGIVKFTLVPAFEVLAPFFQTVHQKP